MQTQVLFEHPLNEKMRTWLRIEFLIQQLTVNLKNLTGSNVNSRPGLACPAWTRAVLKH